MLDLEKLAAVPALKLSRVETERRVARERGRFLARALLGRARASL